MVFGLSTAHQIGLAVTGAAFIVFALISSFVLPRSNPNFPGRRRNWYLALCVVFFLAMMSAVVVFGREQGEAQAAETTTNPSETTTTPAKPSGNALAGKALFAKSGCASCHTFAPAGATGKVGPDLDKLAESAATAKQPLDQFIETSIADPNAYIAPGFQPGVMPKFKFTPEQVDDLVAFLSSGS
jgi:mono/diheme cytochrome c family protein